MPPLLVNNECATDLLVTANLFNDLFREQCTPITNDGSLPNKHFNINTNAIIQLIRLVDPNKAYGCDGISICMLKLYATSISKPLHILFNNLVMNGKKQILSQFIKKVTNK